MSIHPRALTDIGQTADMISALQKTKDELYNYEENSEDKELFELIWNDHCYSNPDVEENLQEFNSIFIVFICVLESRNLSCYGRFICPGEFITAMNSLDRNDIDLHPISKKMAQIFPEEDETDEEDESEVESDVEFGDRYWSFSENCWRKDEEEEEEDDEQ